MAQRFTQAVSSAELNQHDVAEVLATDEATVDVWLRGTRSPGPSEQERLLELLTVLERLSLVLKPRAAHEWLFTPNPLLGDRPPADVIRGGEARRVLGAIDAFAEGVFV